MQHSQFKDHTLNTEDTMNLSRARHERLRVVGFALLVLILGVSAAGPLLAQQPPNVSQRENETRGQQSREAMPPSTLQGKRQDESEPKSGPLVLEKPRATIKTWWPILDLAPDGKTLASPDLNQITLWDTRTGRRKRTIKVRVRATYAEDHVLFSPDGTTLATLASGGNNIGINLYDVRTGKPKRLFRLPQCDYTQFVFSADGKTLAAADFDGRIRLLDTETGRQRGVLEEKDQWVSRMIFSPTGETLASMGWDAKTSRFPGGGVGRGKKDPGAATTIHLWDTRYAKKRATLDCADHFVTSAVVFLPDGKSLVSLGFRALALWDTETGEMIRKLELGAESKLEPSLGQKMVLAPGGKTLLLCSRQVRSDTLWHWDLQTGQLKQTPLPNAAAGPFFATAFSPSGTILALAEPEAIKLWDTQTGRHVATLKSVTGPIGGHALPSGRDSLVFSPDEKTLAVASPKGLVSLWDTEPFASKADSQPPPESTPAPTTAAAAAEPNLKPKPELRTWTSTDGKFTVEAQFVKAVGGTVYLKRKDGKEIEVAIEKLSPEDQRFVRKR